MSNPILPDWTRWAWASAAEREWWAPLFSAASTSYQMIERLAVVEGVRDAAYQIVSTDNLVREGVWAREHGLLCIPLTQTAIVKNYSSKSDGSDPNGPLDYRVLYVRPERYQDTIGLTDQDSDRLGALLGYPICCREAFRKTWGQGQVDSTWEQTLDGRAPNGPWAASTLMRWRGLRFVSHMPCQYQCTASAQIGQQMYDVGVKYGYREEMMLIREVLNWPVKWSRLFGIAELVTPGLKISTRSDWTPTKQAFTREGTYVQPVKEWWIENGFDARHDNTNAEGMRATHRQMIDALLTQLPKNARVLDLGCGNGHLLRRLTIHRPDISIAGVDTNETAINRSRMPLNLKASFWHNKIESGVWREWNATTVLYTPQRLKEMSNESATKVRSWIAGIHQQVPYIYGDVLRAAGPSLRELCEGLQLPAPTPLIKTPLVEMGVAMSLI